MAHQLNKLQISLLLDWGQAFSYDFLTPEWKAELFKLATSEKFKELSPQKFAEAIGVSRSTVLRMRTGEITMSSIRRTELPQNEDQNGDNADAVNKRRGRPQKLCADEGDFVIKTAYEKRKLGHAVTINWLTNECNLMLTAKRKKVSRFTIRRLLMKHGWRRRKSMKKQAFCLTGNYHWTIRNWRIKMSAFFKEHQGVTVHIMDESGVYTNMFPRYTYVSPDDKAANVITHHDTTKDTVVVTLSSNGNASMFYVPFRNATHDKKGCSGVGIDEMRKWTMHFLTYAQAGDILIMDNLAAHHDASVRDMLRKHGIIVKYFPVRGASKLSPLDNSFFVILKFHLEQRFHELVELSNIELREMKLKIIKEEISKLISKGVGLSYFKHCGYDEMTIYLLIKYLFQTKKMKTMMMTIYLLTKYQSQ